MKDVEKPWPRIYINIGTTTTGVAQVAKAIALCSTADEKTWGSHGCDDTVKWIKTDLKMCTHGSLEIIECAKLYDKNVRPYDTVRTQAAPSTRIIIHRHQTQK